MNELKYCKFCGKEKPIKDFAKSGFAIKNICRECQNKKNNQIYKNSKKVEKLEQENKKQKEVINKAIEYLTSYSSIHTIQFGTENDSLNDIELNKTLDEKTLNEMTNRYLKVHDKLLEILKEVSE